MDVRPRARITARAALHRSAPSPRFCESNCPDASDSESLLFKRPHRWVMLISPLTPLVLVLISGGALTSKMLTIPEACASGVIVSFVGRSSGVHYLLKPPAVVCVSDSNTSGQLKADPASLLFVARGPVRPAQRVFGSSGVCSPRIGVLPIIALLPDLNRRSLYSVVPWRFPDPSHLAVSPAASP
ncbi:hypothetical protein B0H15DRAFT_949351 [Mycena belliarum]|uniref:Uncharacterized protein n=1 Tax=Mycena belliarum TaxID=1033014 RepID=A0AAD6XM26_9AGAR|nr:hypothetical protein B0H15DRAFT_949351 [Mycena belliae]